MICPNCGHESEGAKFCPECGARLAKASQTCEEAPQACEEVAYPPLDQPCLRIINGYEVDLNAVIRCYGMGLRKMGAYSYLATATHITTGRAKAILNPLYAAHEGETITFTDGIRGQLKMHCRKLDPDRPDDPQKAAIYDKRKKAEAEGFISCPKCASVNITAGKRGFGVGRAVVGSALGAGTGLLLGAIGSQKVVCTCLKCGYQWRPGKE